MISLKKADSSTPIACARASKKTCHAFRTHTSLLSKAQRERVTQGHRFPGHSLFEIDRQLQLWKIAFFVRFRGILTERRL
ncbi:hypothetical protein CWR43_14415 [Rhizobium sullae]|uniref:Uncharacterized protein n=1 Tax=Rhizobium sullae TaxID=50338 RepID=A0A2N0DAY7_RHISU|nr:hypothetical protein CWR43_14415 [Rhizobium sullae]